MLFGIGSLPTTVKVTLLFPIGSLESHCPVEGCDNEARYYTAKTPGTGFFPRTTRAAWASDGGQRCNDDSSFMGSKPTPNRKQEGIAVFVVPGVRYFTFRSPAIPAQALAQELSHSTRFSISSGDTNGSNGRVGGPFHHGWVSSSTPDRPTSLVVTTSTPCSRKAATNAAGLAVFVQMKSQSIHASAQVHSRRRAPTDLLARFRPLFPPDC